MPAAFLISVFLSSTAVLPTGPQQRLMHNVEPSPLAALPADFESSGILLPDRDGEHILVVVASGLEIALAPELSQFSADLTAEGYNVSQITMAGGSVEDLKSTLQSEPELDGAILIGNIPRAWYEKSWGDDDNEEFPMDLFLMDLNGTWVDSDSDGKYDTHTGHRAPEIWTGRIDAHAMEFGSEISMLRNYFMKNHLYRTGALAVPGRAVTFIDDDWSYYSTCGLNAIYTDLTVVNGESQTTAAAYRTRLDTGYEFVHLMAHSSPWGHTFKIPSGYGGTVMAPEISVIDPQTVFVQLFACSNCRWTEPNCLGNWYLFGTNYGLLAFGSTKTGAMLDFEELYTPMGLGEIPGAAFRTWFTNVGIFDPDWHYGCVILGDPTLMPLSSRDACQHPVTGAGTPMFDDYVKVSTSIHSDCYPVVANCGDITWIGWTTAQNGRLDIATRAWDGDSWSQVYFIDSDEYWDVTPCMTVDGEGIPWLAWADFDISNYGYRIKTATGEYLTTVTTAADVDGYDLNPCLAYTDRMWLVWQVWQRGEGDIMIKALDSSYPETYLTDPGNCCFSPTACATPDGNIFAAWVEGSPQGERIMWTQGDENGFAEPLEISSGSFCRSPCVAACGSTVIMAWQDDTDGTSIRAIVWEGSGWSTEAILFSESSGHAFASSAGTSPSGVPLVAWQTSNGTDAEIWQSTLTASGWSNPAQLVNPTGPAWLPALHEGVAAWAGTGGTDNWDIYVSLEGGLGITDFTSGAQIFDFRLMENPVRETAVLSPGMMFTGIVSLGISVFDISGRIVSTINTDTHAGDQVTVPCEELPSGVYVIRVSSDAGEWTDMMTILR